MRSVPLNRSLLTVLEVSSSVGASPPPASGTAASHGSSPRPSPTLRRAHRRARPVTALRPEPPGRSPRGRHAQRRVPPDAPDVGVQPWTPPAGARRRDHGPAGPRTPGHGLRRRPGGQRRRPCRPGGISCTRACWWCPTHGTSRRHCRLPTGLSPASSRCCRGRRTRRPPCGSAARSGHTWSARSRRRACNWSGGIRRRGCAHWPVRRSRCPERFPISNPWYARTRVALAPLLAGGGSRLKILEALATGRPVVSTSIGAEGLEDLIGRGVVVADDPAVMAAAVAELLRDPDRSAALGRKGTAAVAADHSWAAAVRPLLAALPTDR